MNTVIPVALSTFELCKYIFLYLKTKHKVTHNNVFALNSTIFSSLFRTISISSRMPILCVGCVMRAYKTTSGLPHTQNITCFVSPVSYVL